jgi:uncharacterized membrane protein YedE/YeeE
MISKVKNILSISSLKVIKQKTTQPYMNPYLAGIGLGIVLLLAFVIMGRGLGASGGFTSILTTGVNAVSSEYATQNEMYSSYIGDGERSPLTDWLVFELIGVIIGGFISGVFAGRIKSSVERGPRISSKGRLVLAVVGGTLMGFAAKMARGCTSGQALTGGALMSVGSWIFMIAIFIGAYAFAYFIRRQWI